MAEAHCISNGVVCIDLYLVKMTWLQWAFREKTWLSKSTISQKRMRRNKEEHLPTDNTCRPKDQRIIVSHQDCINESILGERCKLSFGFTRSLCAWV